MSPDPHPQPPRRSLVYVSGPPGVGKSTLLREITGYCLRQPIAVPFAHDLLTLPVPARLTLPMHSAVELGRRRETFSGTDALPMNVVVAAEQYMTAGGGRAHSLVLAEGDRLANYRFLHGAHRTGWDVTLVHLDAPLPVLDERCAARGSTQNPIWRAGRITKSRRLADTLAAGGLRVVRLDGRNSPGCLTTSLWEDVPVLAALLPGGEPS